MEKNYLSQLKALINSFNFYLKHFLEKPLYKMLWPKYGFLSEIQTLPPVRQKSETAPKIFSR